MTMKKNFLVTIFAKQDGKPLLDKTLMPQHIYE
jgi:hypothetical protein